MKKGKKIKGQLALVLCLTILLTNSLATNVKDVDILENKVVDSAEKEVQDIVKETELNRNQIVGLLAYGYTEDEILDMTMKEADEILTEGMSYEEKSMYYKHIALRSLEEYIDEFPANYFNNNSSTRSYCSVCGYTPSSTVNWNHATATDGYTGDGCFHEDSGTVQSNIYSKCWYAKMLAMTIFDVTSSSGLMFDYYMFGENYGADHPDWAHEGVDMKYYNGASVYSPISGVVTKSSNTNEWVSIYNSSLGITMNFQHITDVDGLGTLQEGNTVSVGQYLGKQSTSNSHVHVQVCDHNSCTSVHSGRDVSLTCIEPYGYH